MELIVSQFHTNKVPTTGLTATVNIRLSDGTVVKTAEAMTEVGGGWYSYEFVEYNKKQIYLIDTDGGSSALDDRCQNITNVLDAYDNKKDWKGGGSSGPSSVALTERDLKTLAKGVWETKLSDLEKQNGTAGRHLSELDTKEILVKIDEIDIPNYDDNLKSLSDKSEDLKKGQTEIKGSVEKHGEFIGNTVGEVVQNLADFNEKTEQQSEQISKKIDVVGKAVKDLPTFDYKRVEDFFSKNVSNLPVLLQINELKEELKKDIQKGNSSDIKEYVLKSIENQQIYEKQIADTELQKEFKNSLVVIGENLDKLSKREIDFVPVYKEIGEIAKKMEEGIKSNSETDREEYKKSMRYIVYIAKNIGIINKNDLTEIKQTLSNMK